MNNNRSHVRILLLFTLVFALCTTTLFTTNAEARRADEVFDSATVSLKTTKKVVYDATTYGTQKTISITNCWLEKKIGSKWVRQSALETPSAAHGEGASADHHPAGNAAISFADCRVGAAPEADRARRSRSRSVSSGYSGDDCAFAENGKTCEGRAGALSFRAGERRGVSSVRDGCHGNAQGILLQQSCLPVRNLEGPFILCRQRN